MDKLPQYLIVNYSEVNVMFPEVQRVFLIIFILNPCFSC